MSEILTVIAPSARSAQAQVNPGLLQRSGPAGATCKTVQNEKPWHRAAACMLAAGLSVKEVAEAHDVSPQTVYNLLRSPWFQEVVTEQIEKHGGRDIQRLFAGEQLNSFVTLLSIRDNEKVSPAVRASVATRILEQVVGKPQQKVEVTQGVRSDDPVAEAERLERENRMLADRLADA